MAIRQAGRRNGVRVLAWAEDVRVRGSFSGSGKGFCKPTATRPTTISAGRSWCTSGCWAHARRKFVDAVKVNPKDGEAMNMVTRMDALFLVDRHARQQTVECR